MLQALTSRYEALQSSTKELMKQIEAIQEEQERVQEEIRRLRVEHSTTLLQLSNELDAAEARLKERRAHLKGMIDSHQTSIVQRTTTRSLESEVKMFGWCLY